MPIRGEENFFLIKFSENSRKYFNLKLRPDKKWKGFRLSICLSIFTFGIFKFFRPKKSIFIALLVYTHNTRMERSANILKFSFLHAMLRNENKITKIDGNNCEVNNNYWTIYSRSRSFPKNFLPSKNLSCRFSKFFLEVTFVLFSKYYLLKKLAELWRNEKILFFSCFYFAARLAELIDDNRFFGEYALENSVERFRYAKNCSKWKMKYRQVRRYGK